MALSETICNFAIRIFNILNHTEPEVQIAAILALALFGLEI
jgi:hypothetical protein